MQSTWASGAIELLNHADTHIGHDTAFDRRIAFISIDNAVETMIRVFLSLPSSKSDVIVNHKERAEVENSFPKMLTLLWNKASKRVTGLDAGDVEHYHRIRNKLYHDGTGLSVDDQYIRAYRRIAAILLEQLFGITSPNLVPLATLENLIAVWDQLDTLIKQKMDEAGVDYGHTFKWEWAIRNSVFDMTFVHELTELRMIRNAQVHSTEVDEDKIKYAIDIATRLHKQLNAS